MENFKYGGKTYYIPERMMGGILRYVNHHIMPGDFLCAIIKNDLTDTIARADEENMENIPAFVNYFYNKARKSIGKLSGKLRKYIPLNKI